jgi:hypothetical protein
MNRMAITKKPPMVSAVFAGIGGVFEERIEDRGLRIAKKFEDKLVFAIFYPLSSILALPGIRHGTETRHLRPGC